MADAPKKYKATLKGHSEQWTQEEHDLVQKVVGDRFGEYTVELLEVATPTDVAAAPTGRTKAAPTSNADTPAA